MKSKKFRVGLVMLIALAIGGVIWLFSRTPEYTTTATLQVIPAAKTASPKTVAQASEVEKPKAAAVSGNGPAAATPADPNAVAQAELKAVFMDIGRLERMDDTATMKETYTYITPSPSDLADIQRAREHQISVAAARARDADNPLTRHLQQLSLAFAQSYEALANQAPVMNSDGDEATYQYIAMTPSDLESATYSGTGEPTPLTFIKINGRWYVKPADYKKPNSQGK